MTGSSFLRPFPERNSDAFRRALSPILISSDLEPSLWPEGAINARSYDIYYTETGRAGGAFLTQDQDGDGKEDWYPVHDPRVFAQGRTIRVGLGVQF